MFLLRMAATAVLFLVLLVTAPIAGALIPLLGLIPPRGDLAWPVGRALGRVILMGGFVRLRREGAERIPRGRPVVFISNHESWLDLPAVVAAIPVPVRFMAKRWLFWVPFFGWGLGGLGCIAVDRDHRRTAVRSFREAVFQIRRGRSVMINAEGTRTATEDLLPFRRGGFLLAVRAGVPIVPIGMDGTRRCLPRHRFLVRPGTITVRFGEPIPTTGLGVNDLVRLTAAVRSAIEALRREPGAAGANPEATAACRGATMRA